MRSFVVLLSVTLVASPAAAQFDYQSELTGGRLLALASEALKGGELKEACINLLIARTYVGAKAKARFDAVVELLSPSERKACVSRTREWLDEQAAKEAEAEVRPEAPAAIVSVAGGIDIVDGDTFAIKGPGGSVSLRLEGVDAPELGEECGECGAGAKTALETVLSQDRPVRCELRYIGPFARLVVRCARRDGKGRDVGRLMVEQGMARRAVRNDPSRRYAGAEFLAQQQGKGLWACDKPAPASWAAAKRARCGQ